MARTTAYLVLFLCLVIVCYCEVKLWIRFWLRLGWLGEIMMIRARVGGCCSAAGDSRRGGADGRSCNGHDSMGLQISLVGSLSCSTLIQGRPARKWDLTPSPTFYRRFCTSPTTATTSSSTLLPLQGYPHDSIGDKLGAATHRHDSILQPSFCGSAVKAPFFSQSRNPFPTESFLGPLAL